MNINELKGKYKSKRGIIKERLNEFLKNKDYFYEMCFCLLTPQSNAKKCYECINILKEKDFLNRNFDVAKYLRDKTRFYRNKSNYLIQYKKNHYKIINEIKRIKCQKFSIQSMTGGQNQSTPRLWKISEHAQEPPTVKPSSNIPPVCDWRFLTNPRQIREYLVENIKGIGYKEASHFLRNIGHRNLAILDRHILKNLKDLKVINDIPKSLSKNKYFEIEKKFSNFSKEINIPMDELDLLFWSIETGEVFR